MKLFDRHINLNRHVHAQCARGCSATETQLIPKARKKMNYSIKGTSTAENCIHRKKSHSHTNIKTFITRTAQMNGTNEARNRLGQLSPRDVRSSSSGQRPGDPGPLPAARQAAVQGQEAPRHRHKQSGHLNFKSAISGLTRDSGAVSEGSGYQPGSAGARGADRDPQPAQLHRKTRFRRFSHTRRKDNSETRAPLPSPFLRYPRHNNQQKTN